MLTIPGSSCAKHELQRSDSRSANATQTARFAGRGYNPTVLASPDFEARLTACGIRSTAQRTQIAALLLAAPQHLSAEQILARLRDAGARVSKATVYNTLKLFAAHGLNRARSSIPLHLKQKTQTIREDRLGSCFSSFAGEPVTLK